jgi:hypothetical protein
MEKETKVTNDGANWLLRGIIGAVIILCSAIILGVEGRGSSQNFAGRSRWLAAYILKALGRVFPQSIKNVVDARRFVKLAFDFMNDIFETVYDNSKTNDG